jgi:cyclohexyl-isocyanide hydratase
VPSDCEFSLVPTRTFADCRPLDLRCVPGGGPGIVAAVSDRETIDFVANRYGQMNSAFRAYLEQVAG